MQTKTWSFLDKSAWARGPWDSEPDKMQWQDEATGLPCLVVRNRMGALCGYVGVAEGHPYFEKGYDDCNVDVHGGLTFANFCVKGEKEHGICHIVDPGENDRVWWLGFDCAHCDDLCPSYSAKYGIEGEYRDLEYVRSECADLARQLKETT